MAYTGTGTANDPFVVDNWNDFISLAYANQSKYIRFADADNKIIDMNDVNPNGYSGQITIKANVDFNGWTIRNLRGNTSIPLLGIHQGQSYNSFNVTLKNGNFENIYQTATSENGAVLGRTNTRNVTISNLTDTVTFSNMSFSGDIISESDNVCLLCQNKEPVASYVKNRSVYNFNGCAFNFHTNAKSIYLFGAATLNDCNVKVDAPIANSVDINKLYVTANPASNTNSLFTINAPNAKINFSDSSKIKTTASVGLITALSLSSVGQLFATIANSDTTSIDTATGIIPCTTEQLKNAEYLQSIGFPIGE